MSKTAPFQTITPELGQWIVAQAEAGDGPEAVLKSMLASGWDEEVAVEAMDATLRAPLGRRDLPPERVLAQRQAGQREFI